MRDEWNSSEQEASRRTRRAVLVGALVAVGFFAFMQYYGRDAETRTELKDYPGSSETTTVIESIPTEIRLPPDQRPLARPPAAYQTQIGVYECTVDGQRVVSDHPCGDDAQARTLTIHQPTARDAVAARQRSITRPAPSVQGYSQP